MIKNYTHRLIIVTICILFQLITLSMLRASGNSPYSLYGTIIIELDTLHNYKGAIQVSLFASDDGFPHSWEKAFAYKTIPITPDLEKIMLHDIPYGNYALAVIHDENENFKLDTNFLGIPREGYGFSNNVRGRFGPPSFKAASFTLNEKEMIHKIKMNY